MVPLDVKSLLILILVLIVVRWAVPTFFPVLNGLVGPLCVGLFLLGLWQFIIQPLIGRR